jgi:hypothetical protein
MSFHSKIKPGRDTKRARVLMVGSLMTPDGARRVTIRDISRTGAQVACDENIPADCDVLFRRGDLFAAAHVAWANKGEAGLRFYREISEEEIDGCLPAALLRGPSKDQ